MSLPASLASRCDGKCELCTAETALSEFDVPASEGQDDTSIALCEICSSQIASSDYQVQHWRSLSDTMWSPIAPVQVMAWRTLKKLDSESWAQDALDMLYLDEALLNWAEAGIALEEEQVVHLDSNGAKLAAGDNVVIIKDLPVKGTSFVAKRGTAVRGIGVTSNPEHIEGRVNGTRIVILTKYVKKS